MTIAQIYEDAKRKLDNNEITIGEFAKIVDVEVRDFGSNGCQDCAFESVEEWEMPCCKCLRCCKDYWRLKPKESE